jgi:hypothetical protein
MEKFNKTEREELFRKNKELITSKNVKKIFKEVFGKTEQFDLKIFYDFLGELLLKKTLSSWKFLKNYLKFVKKVKIPLDRLLELEGYLIEKYCIFKNEEILRSFHGNVKHHKVVFTGRVFLTNYRIIVIGRAEESFGSAILSSIG